MRRASNKWKCTSCGAFCNNACSCCQACGQDRVPTRGIMDIEKEEEADNDEEDLISVTSTRSSRKEKGKEKEKRKSKATDRGKEKKTEKEDSDSKEKKKKSDEMSEKDKENVIDEEEEKEEEISPKPKKGKGRKRKPPIPKEKEEDEEKEKETLKKQDLGTDRKTSSSPSSSLPAALLPLFPILPILPTFSLLPLDTCTLSASGLNSSSTITKKEPLATELQLQQTTSSIPLSAVKAQPKNTKQSKQKKVDDSVASDNDNDDDDTKEKDNKDDEEEEEAEEEEKKDKKRRSGSRSRSKKQKTSSSSSFSSSSSSSSRATRAIIKPTPKPIDPKLKRQQPPNSFGVLDVLPRSIFEYLLDFLTPKDLARLSVCCKELNKQVSELPVWSKLYQDLEIKGELFGDYREWLEKCERGAKRMVNTMKDGPGLHEWVKKNASTLATVVGYKKLYGCLVAKCCAECGVVTPFIHPLVAMRVCKACCDAHEAKYAIVNKSMAQQVYLLTKPQIERLPSYDVKEFLEPGGISHLNETVFYSKTQVEHAMVERWGSAEEAKTEMERRMKKKNESYEARLRKYNEENTQKAETIADTPEKQKRRPKRPKTPSVSVTHSDIFSPRDCLFIVGFFCGPEDAVEGPVTLMSHHIRFEHPENYIFHFRKTAYRKGSQCDIGFLAFGSL